ncbi:MAG: hypothetical protein U9R74_04195 [Pseudomonadota bacterium]|nr:hypothetical protein [Pseudomonadota bacterium]
MKRSAAFSLIVLVGAGSGGNSLVETVGAASFGPMNMMNPSRWFGGGNRDDDYYGSGYGAPYGSPGYWAPGYGAPPAYGYGAPPAGGYQQGYGAPPAGGYQQGYGAAAPAEDPSAARIKELEERIHQLESSQPAVPPYPQSAQPYNPAGQTWSPQGSEPYPPAGQPYPGETQPYMPQQGSGVGGYQQSSPYQSYGPD